MQQLAPVTVPVYCGEKERRCAEFLAVGMGKSEPFVRIETNMLPRREFEQGGFGISGHDEEALAGESNNGEAARFSTKRAAPRIRDLE
jgi:hypothetical protein